VSRVLKRRNRVVLWILVVAFVASIVVAGGLELLRPAQPGGAEERVLTVDGRPTNRQEFAQAYSNLLAQFRQFYAMYGMDFEALLRGTEGAFRSLQFRSQAAEGVIRSEILDQAARELRVRIPRTELDQAVNARFQSILAQQGITEQQLAELLRLQRLTIETYRAELARWEEDRLEEERVRQQVVGPVEPTEADLLAYFQANPIRYQTEPERVQVGHILVRDARLADELLGQVGAPAADFAALAAAHSLDEATRARGGETEWFSRDRAPFSTEVVDAIWPAEVGQVKLVDDDAGFHIVKLLGRRPAVVPPLAEVLDTVRADYIRDEERRRWDEWYAARRGRVTVRAEDPVLAAAMALGTDEALALAELVAARDAGTSDDPYLSYFIGRLHEQFLTRAARRRLELAQVTARTPEEEAEFVRVQAEEADHMTQAVAAYLEFIETGEADEPFFQRVLAIDPRNHQFRYALAELYREAGNWLQAEAEYRLAIEANPSFAEAHTSLGDVLTAMGLHRRAIEAYRTALELHPASLSLRLKLAAAYLADGQPSLAQPLLQEVLGREPENTTALTLTGDLLLAQGDAVGAIARYTAAYSIRPTSGVLVKLAGAHLAAGQVADARRRYEEAVRRFPHQAEGHLGLGNVHLTLGNTAGALAAYRQALRFAGVAALRETIARRIVDLDPTDIRTRYLLASALREQYKYEPAIRQYEAILALSPDSLDALLGLGDSWLARVQYDRALDYYRQALAQPTTARQRLPIYGQMVAVEEARAGAGRPLGPQGLEFLWQRAQLYQQLGRSSEAIADLERIVSEDATFRTEEVTTLLATLRAGRAR